MRTESDNPSSRRVGAGKEGGGVTGLAGVGEDDRDCVSEAARGVEGGASSRMVFDELTFVGGSRLWMRFVKKPESLLEERV